MNRTFTQENGDKLTTESNVYGGSDDEGRVKGRGSGLRGRGSGGRGGSCLYPNGVRGVWRSR